ncbi:MAG: ATP-binding protein, partial [Acidimicrobiales bacterium]
MVEGRTIHLLGAVRAVQGDSEHPLAGVQARRVLVFLALEQGRPVSNDELAQVLWPDGPGRHWEGALRGVISKVRAFLAPLGPSAASIENVGRTYRLHLGEGITVDVEEAGRDVADAEARMAEDRATEAARSAERAVDLLSAPLLAGEQGEWLDRRRAGLGVLRRRALRVASAAQSALGWHDAAVASARSALTDDPCDEESQRALMRAHLEAADRSASLAVYGECRRALADALGVAPSPETEALHLQLLAGEVTPRPHGNTALARRAGLAKMTERPFVGRDHELSVLAHAWELARAGRRQVVLVHGEPGVGKTRVALEVAKRFVPPRLLYGRASAEDSMPFEPFAEALTRQAELLDDDDLAALVTPFDRELARVAPVIGSRRGMGSTAQVEGDDRPRTFEAVRTVVERIALAPTILVLDDLHWADASTLLLLRHVVRTLERTRLLVIATYRDDGEPSAAWAEAITEMHRLDGCHTLPIVGLEPSEIVELLRASRIERPDELGAALAERTGGNPFYLTQVLTATTEDPGSFDPFHVPETVSNLVRHRVATLSPDARSVLAIGAVLGTTMAAATLERAVLDGGGRVETIDELLDRHLLVEVEVGRYSFAHAIARDAVYGQLSCTRRRHLHLDAARAVAASGSGDPESAAAEAHHYRLAEDPAHAVELVEATVRAADHAMQVLAFEQAADLYGEAVGYVSRFGLDDPRAAALHVGLGAALRRTGDFAAARRALGVAVELARAPGREAVFGEAVLELVAKAGRGVSVDLPDAERAELLQEAVDRLDSSRPDDRGGDHADDGASRSALLVSLLAELALALLLTDQTERRRSVAERAVRLARTGGTVDLA